MARYIAPNNRQVTIPEFSRYCNQVILSGVNESYPISKGIFFIEYLEAASGTTVTVSDGNGNAIVSGIANFDQEYSPIRCDYGVEITGELVMLKGFFVQGVFQE
jgi:hypothetical protein